MLSRPKNKSYDIRGQKYNIPEFSDVNTPVDTSGFVDQWPAHASRRSVAANQLMVTRDSHIVVLGEKETKLPIIAPKPKFLDYLEQYVSKELRQHGAERVEANPIRLQIYREVFDWLIAAFQTYKPIMADIKREYDMMLSYLREEVRHLEPMREMIWTISEEKNQDILRIKEQEKEEVKILKEEKAVLLTTIGELKANEVTLEIQIETLKQKLEEEYLAYRNEADSRKLLIIDLNELRQQNEDMANLKRQQETNSDDDPIVLKLGLEQAKKAHSDLLFEITRMRTDYADVVPKRDFERLTEEYHLLTEKSNNMDQKLAQLEVNHQALEEKFTALQQQRDFYYSKYMDLARSSTPRPDWKKCGDIVSAGPTWWQEQSKGKTTKDLVELLLQEINMSQTVKVQVDGKGTDSTVLTFLRAEGKINIRPMLKRDVKIHIREIWAGRHLLKKEQNEALSRNREYLLPVMPDYVDFFFKKTYGFDQIRLEWAYSFFENLQKEKNDEYIIQFRKILLGEMDEEVYWEEMVYLNTLMENFRSKDTEKRELIPKEDFKMIIETMDICKGNEEIINNLMEIATADMSAVDDVLLPYKNLFMTDDEGEFGPFYAEIRKLRQAEKLKYIAEIEKEMRDLGSKISATQLRDCIQIVDPEITEEISNKYIMWCFSAKSMEETLKMESLSTDQIVYRLTMGATKRLAPRS